MTKYRIPSELLRVATTQAGVVSRRQVLLNHIPEHAIPRLVAAGQWSHVTRNVYNILPGHTWDDPIGTSRLRAAWVGLLAIPGSIATGQCALALHGVWGLPRKLRPEVALPNGRKTPGPCGVHVRRYRHFETATVRGQKVASPVAALVQAIPEMSRDAAVSVLDSALNRRKITAESLTQVERMLTGRRGAKRVRPWLALADGRADSPFETLARLQARDAGLPRPELQVEVWDEGIGAVARGDLGWQREDGTWVLIDLDGKTYHETPKALFVDRHRQNAIALTARYTHLRFTWADLRTGVIPRMVSRALQLPPVPPARGGGG